MAVKMMAAMALMKAHTCTKTRQPRRLFGSWSCVVHEHTPCAKQQDDVPRRTSVIIIMGRMMRQSESQQYQKGMACAGRGAAARRRAVA